MQRNKFCHVQDCTGMRARMNTVGRASSFGALYYQPALKKISAPEHVYMYVDLCFTLEFYLFFINLVHVNFSKQPFFMVYIYLYGFLRELPL